MCRVATQSACGITSTRIVLTHRQTLLLCFLPAAATTPPLNGRTNPSGRAPWPGNCWCSRILVSQPSWSLLLLHTNEGPGLWWEILVAVVALFSCRIPWNTRHTWDRLAEKAPHLVVGSDDMTELTKPSHFLFPWRFVLRGLRDLKSTIGTQSGYLWLANPYHCTSVLFDQCNLNRGCGWDLLLLVSYKLGRYLINIIWRWPVLKVYARLNLRKMWDGGLTRKFPIGSDSVRMTDWIPWRVIWVQYFHRKERAFFKDINSDAPTGS